ncbi:hypothetical protein MKZ38_003621 [Zalerion maritima]|uniref:Uncharacterized protein n=1 Tax=Zalerion maritima TaxID=339359 RepID=A0AAD5WRM7_9PEZI|nr:hypothetical protein MKZ38_003621 [Zalerion maritima]
MREPQLHRARLVSSIAATVISIACGTNYVYSAWAPQFADRLGLSATQSNLIGLAGNLGMYSCGIPVGWLIDGKGPRPGVLLGSVLLGLGYFPLHQAYDIASGSVALLCVFSFMSGLGGCLAFQGAVKTSALNWPHHRGTATAFPLAAFGLSAFFFSLIGTIFVPGDTSSFLAILAFGTCGITFLGFFFLRVYPHTTHYHAIPDGNSSGSQLLRRTSTDDKIARDNHEPATAISQGPPLSSHSSSSDTANPPNAARLDVEAAMGDAPFRREDGDDETGDGEVADETSSLISSESSLAGEVLVDRSVDRDRSHRVDIRGFALLRELEFWQQFAIMALLSGIGLMTINNIGNDVLALWRKYDPKVTDKYLANRQQMHVSILSVCSFSGRLLSGVGSDFLVKVLNASRVWCLVFASLIFSIAQICALTITNPHWLGFVSGLSGLGYGFLFGVFPSIVAESFGIHGLSTNWGFMTLAPVISSNIFNIFYGVVYDNHTTVGDNGSRQCNDGLSCYWAAYLVTLGACLLGILITGGVIRHQKLERLKEQSRRPD